MNDETSAKQWREAQDKVLLGEFRNSTGRTAESMEEAEGWFIGLSLAERDRVGRRLNDSSVIGRHLQTPKIHYCEHVRAWFRLARQARKKNEELDRWRTNRSGSGNGSVVTGPIRGQPVSRFPHQPNMSRTLQGSLPWNWQPTSKYPSACSHHLTNTSAHGEFSGALQARNNRMVPTGTSCWTARRSPPLVRFRTSACCGERQPFPTTRTAVRLPSRRMIPRRSASATVRGP